MPVPDLFIIVRQPIRSKIRNHYQSQNDFGLMERDRAKGSRPEELYGSLFTRSDGRIDLILNFDFAKHQLIKARIDLPFLSFSQLLTPDRSQKFSFPLLSPIFNSNFACCYARVSDRFRREFSINLGNDPK